MLMWGGNPSNRDMTCLDLDAGDGRGHERIPIRCSILIFQRSAAGGIKAISAKVLDMSSSGALIRAWQPMEIASKVRIRGNEFLTGMAQVRHCTRQGFGFRIGLEFATALPKRY